MHKNEGYVGRFAPSPTGLMHVGNIRSALLSWLHCRLHQGQFILRIEDLDRGRVRAGAEADILSDLEWLGLEWDHFYRQSDRLLYYETALAQLQTYPCHCSRKDIQAAASAPHHTQGVYPGTCRPQGIASIPNSPHSLRWWSPNGFITACDSFFGSLTQNIHTEIGDIVLKRNDGCIAYHLAVVVDDHLMGVNHVVRGEDLWPSTPTQIALQTVLGFGHPYYHHVPLMRDYRGERLAKRQGAPAVKALRESGLRPQVLLADLAKSLNWQTPSEVTLEELFEPARNYFRHSNAKLSV